MFRVKRAVDHSAILWANVVLLAIMVAATGLTTWLVAEIRQGQRAIRRIVQEGGLAEGKELLDTLRGDLRWQLVFTVLVLIVLILAAGALVVVVRSYVKSLAPLRERKILARDILASMDWGVITTNHEGKITSVTPRGQELLGADFDCVGLSIDDVCKDAQPLAEAGWAVLESGKGQYDLDFSVTRRGHRMQLRADCHVLRDIDDEILGIVLHIRDVTERIFIEERMRRMDHFFSLGALASGLHHEIKNPLSALSLHVQLLEECLEHQADEETMSNLGVLKTEVTRIAGVLESFRDYASIENLDQAPTDISGLVRQTVELIRPQAQQQGVQLVVKLPDDGLPSIPADAVRLEQVLLNLVINALDEMREGGTLTLAASATDEEVIVEVSDTGRGIPDNVRARIFDPYFSTKSVGSGMGLAVCDKIVRQHAGRIDVDTGPSGTSFRISLPMDVD